MYKTRLNTVEMAFLAVVGLFLNSIALNNIKEFKTEDFDIKFRASQKTYQAIQILREEFLKRGFQIDPINDPMESGLIGPRESPITTGTSELYIKHTQINPNFSALFIEWLKTVGIRENDLVAVGFSGSFPLLNIAAIIAVETMGAKPVIITSLGSSAYGANSIGWTWFDIEKILKDKGIIQHTSVAGSFGGGSDIGRGLDKKGLEAMDSIFRFFNIPLIHEIPLSKSVEKRLNIYKSYEVNKKYKVFINIGGGEASTGGSLAQEILNQGINYPEKFLELEPLPVKGVVYYFLKEGIPVINVDDVITLAKEYKFPIAPAAIQPPGQGPLFYRKKYSIPVVFVLLLSYTSIFAAILLKDIFERRKRKNEIV